ncbi:LysR family transcriptional regulator [Rhodovulum sp. BSW8]|uniref:LysR family transcriptional regulator n=1 Tax=Rhodovulum visakhapatnamense TaxID=364297 RepID=A0ABS1RKE9_9RHOB|nr:MULTISPECIES: LysR family transcriptional regulator [Rhodovulum]MBL3569781.1 LysR family transcriptional regulator [Rhodovulum visakhapatnamense]MBL3580149.1 LysR family transcriptional regulator [Rhodovulum visakhapatnamense]OLS42389.1 LysR family transcriptional regulator [Rhodovulum sulfidophilum]RBO53842.1 LysR family transcriptional regulator [Rhodovulum sp. BSW8]
MVDLQPLLLLRAVARHGSLAAAAEALNLSQSAASHTMRRFADRHGVAIWERDGRGLRLTQTGEWLLAFAERVLPQFDHADRVLADFATGQRGSLRLGMECHPCEHWLMRVIEPFLNDWPQVDLDLTTAFRFGGVGALLGHEIDLLVTPDPLEHPGLTHHPVYPYELVLAVPEGHALTRKPHAAPADLTGETLITYPVEPERLDIFTRFLVPGHVRPRRHRTVETSELMLRMVAAGRGISSIPDWLIRDLPEGAGVAAVRIGAGGIFKTIHLSRRTGEAADFLTGFVSLAATHAGQTGSGAKLATIERSSDS